MASAVPTSFPRFQQLPAELRIKIWNDALPDPRTIHLTMMNDPRRNINTLLSSVICVPTLPCPRSVYNLLQACTESRHEILSHYEPLIVPKVPDSPFSPIHYFDPYREGIFIDRIWPWRRGEVLRRSGMFKTRCLNIACNAWWSFWNPHPDPRLIGRNGLLLFRNLEELHIIFRVLGDVERIHGVRYNRSGYMRPGTLQMARLLADIEFPNPSINITKEPILQKLAALKKIDPTWKVPKVKLTAWAATPNFPRSTY